MKRTILLTIIFTTTILIALGVLIALPQTMPDPARAALDQYLNYRYDQSTQPVAILAITRATLPTQFTRAMSGATFGASKFFGTSVNYRQSESINLPSFATPSTDRSAAPYQFSIGNPLPYPPLDVWCARVSQDQERTMFIALHQALYNADWIVHEHPGDWTTNDLAQTLTNLGCSNP